MDILYRECRFNVMLRMFRTVKPDITKSELFNILGGVTDSLYIYELQRLKIYILIGGDERSRIDKFFQYYSVDHERVKIKEFLKEEKDFDKYYYILPIIPEFLNEDEFAEKSKITLGFSYAMIKEYNEKENRIYLETVNISNPKVNWINTKELLKLNDYENLILKNYCIYKVNKEKFKKNKVINDYCKKELKDLVIENSENFLYGCNDVEIFDSINGEEFYTYVIHHFRKLKDILVNKDKYEKYHELITYYKFQINYMRSILLAGTDTFYRGEFIDTLEVLDKKYTGFDKNMYIDDWHKSSKIWRKMGRLMKAMLTNLDEDKVNKLIEYFEVLREIEMSSMTQILQNLKKL